MLACHRCDTASCVRPDHLYEGTNADNVADRVSRGRQPRGEQVGVRSGARKLTTAEVAAIRSDTRGHSELARVLGVHRTTVSAIRCGKRWLSAPSPGAL
jgi:DNA-binding transcriptional regulator YiaG